jgi:hypothetical protein
LDQRRLTPGDVQKWVKVLAKTHKPNTLRNIFGVLRLVLD